MVESNVPKKKKAFLGMEIPIPWLVAIVFGLVFNAGIFYTQFSDIKTQVKETGDYVRTNKDQVQIIEKRLDRAFDRDNRQDEQILDHEQRLRNVEKDRRK